jgi:very-short-patch-repair endonuclease
MKQVRRYLRGNPIIVASNRSFIKSSIKFRASLIENATPSENSLREFLSEYNICYRFQLPVFITSPNNRREIIRFYIPDFYIPSLNLIIELDGKHHYTEAHLKRDKIRDDELKELGYNILRLPNRLAYNYNYLFNQLIKGQWKN